MATWRYLAYDLRTNVVLDELPLTDVNFGQTLNAASDLSASLSFAVAADTVAAARVLRRLRASSSIPERTALFVERDGSIVWGGIIWTRTRTKSTLVADIQAAEFWSYFARLTLRSTKSYTATDQLTIAQDLITTAQAMTGANIGVTVGTETSGVVRDLKVNAYEARVISDLVEQLAKMSSGFDVAIDVDPATRPPVKTLRLSYPRRGRVAGTTGIVFELGKNLLDYEVLEDGTRSARSVDALGAGDGTAMLRSTATRTDLLDAGYPLTIDTVSAKDIDNQANLDSTALGAVAARAATPTFWKITVDPDHVDAPFGSWITGDDCRVRIPDDEFFPQQTDGSPGLDGYWRIISWTCQVPTQGKETVVITLGAING